MIRCHEYFAEQKWSARLTKLSSTTQAAGKKYFKFWQNYCAILIKSQMKNTQQTIAFYVPILPVVFLT